MKTKQLQNSPACDIIQVKDGWLICPRCGRCNVLRLRPDTLARNLIVYCKRCHAESVVDISPKCQCL